MITVGNSTAIDRERRPVHYVTLQATDGGSRTDTTLIEIVLEDINDFSPEMARDSYSAFITEDTVNTLNIKIEVGHNPILFYAVDSVNYIFLKRDCRKCLTSWVPYCTGRWRDY